MLAINNSSIRARRRPPGGLPADAGPGLLLQRQAWLFSGGAACLTLHVERRFSSKVTDNVANYDGMMVRHDETRINHVLRYIDGGVDEEPGDQHSSCKRRLPSERTPETPTSRSEGAFNLNCSE